MALGMEVKKSCEGLEKEVRESLPCREERMEGEKRNTAVWYGMRMARAILMGSQREQGWGF